MPYSGEYVYFVKLRFSFQSFIHRMFIQRSQNICKGGVGEICFFFYGLKCRVEWFPTSQIGDD